jgi:hypothetical protein
MKRLEGYVASCLSYSQVHRMEGLKETRDAQTPLEHVPIRIGTHHNARQDNLQ